MTKDFTNIYKKYKGKWVAMNEGFNKVVASGSNAKVLYKKAQKMGYEVPNLFKVPSNNNAYIG